MYDALKWNTVNQPWYQSMRHLNSWSVDAIYKWLLENYSNNKHPMKQKKGVLRDIFRILLGIGTSCDIRHPCMDDAPYVKLLHSWSVEYLSVFGVDRYTPMAWTVTVIFSLAYVCTIKPDMCVFRGLSDGLTWHHLSSKYFSESDLTIF